MVIVALLVKRGAEQGAMARLEALVDRYVVLLQRRGNSRGAAKIQIIHNVDYGVSLSGDGTLVQQRDLQAFGAMALFVWLESKTLMSSVNKAHETY